MPVPNAASLDGLFLEEIEVGMTAVVEKTFTDADVTLFAGVSGDTNPLHLSENFAAKTRFKTRVVHGMLTTSLWSTIIGTRLPGPGCAYVRQETAFRKPVHIGDTVTAVMTVSRIDTARQRVILDGECRVGEVVVATGQAEAWVPKRPQAS